MAEIEIPKVTKFKHFTSLQNICKVLNAAVMKKDSKFIGGYFWVNSDINISQIQPRFYQIFVTRIKPGSDVKVRPDKWTKDMMNWPFMEIDISHNCEAQGCNGFPGMIGTDGIKIKFFKGTPSSFGESPPTYMIASTSANIPASNPPAAAPSAAAFTDSSW